MSPSFAVRRFIGAPGSGKFNEIVECFKQAYSEDHFARSVTGGKTDIYHLLNYSVLLSGVLSGEVYIIEEVSNGSKVVAAAVWFPPNRELFEESEQGKAAGPFMASLFPELGHWWGTRFLPEYNDFAKTKFGEGVRKAAWHLQWIGTLKPYRCRGLGTMLIDVIRDKKKDRKMCLEVEKPENLKFYRKCGFKAIDEEAQHFECYNVHQEPGFVMWAMLSD
ncbi:hypothetical protein F5146DRAFT_1132078 [Armillaria mellea]|nr:hypothetical protein F5146DRAFT_1132078 [Armillaria mellea]